jgi:hypothetical protein
MTFKKCILISVTILAILSLAPFVVAGDRTPKKWMVGTEVDLVPYLYDGYYLSAVAGYSNWRLRFVRTKITTPGFATPGGFEDNKLDVNAFIVDYYLQEGFTGWWIGPGYETWDGEVREKTSGVAEKYRAGILTLGGGYTYRFNDYFYLNPWAAVHLPMSGDRQVQFANSTFRVRAAAEASIKIGINF